MRRWWDCIFGIDREISIWIEEEELGQEKPISFKKRNFLVKIPQVVEKQITLRLKGLGKTRFGKTGDLFLHLWLNKGEDVKRNLWISDTDARMGTEKFMFTGNRNIVVTIPRGSYNGRTIRLKGLGWKPKFGATCPVI